MLYRLHTFINVHSITVYESGATCGPTPTDYGGPLSHQRWTDTLHQLSNIYIFYTTIQENADAQLVPLQCWASVIDAEPTSQQRRLSVTCLLWC